MSSPLEGVRVVDLTTTLAGATCTMLLADFGADVIRLTDALAEEARGDACFVALDRGKSVVTVTEDDRERAAELLASADVVVTAVADREVLWRDEVDRIAGGDPRMILVRMPPVFAPTGSEAGVESAGMLSAALGLGFRQYSTGGVPVDPVYPHVLYTQGAWTAICIVAALIERLGSGAGQTVTVGGEHGALISAFATYGFDPAQPTLPPPGPGGPNPFYSRYRCADGEWVFLGSLTEKFQRIALDTLGVADVLEDPRIGGDLDATGTAENRDWVRARFASAFLSRTASEWLTALRAAGCPVGELLSRDTWLDHPQLEAIGMRSTFVSPEVGTVTSAGVPLALSGTPALPPAAAKSVSIRDLSAPPRAPSATRIRSGAGEGPLSGVTVLNLGVVLAGPLAGNLLAELGADVVKIEPPTGDPFRNKGFQYNRGMRSLAIDLRDPRGSVQFRHLVARADVVIDNFRSGVLDRLGIDHASLLAVNPGVTSVSITGFGDRGPLRNEPGFDPVLGAMSGMMYAQGGADEPVMLTVAINDVTAGLMAAFGSCLAVYARRASGSPGQRATTSLAAASAFAQTGELVRFPGRPAARTGSADHLGETPFTRSYRTRDGWVRIHAERSAEGRLREAGIIRSRASEHFEENLEEAMSTETSEQIIEKLAAHGVAAVAARSMSEATSDPRALEADLFHPMAKVGDGPMMVPGRLAVFSRTQRTDVLGPPGLGQHSRDVLEGFGASSEDIESLIRDGVVIEGSPMRIVGMPGYR